MATTDELLDILMKDYKKPEDLIGENGLLKQLSGPEKHCEEVDNAYQRLEVSIEPV